MAAKLQRHVREAEREARRAKVGKLLLAGVTQTKIAEMLTVSDKTIANDVRALVDEWRGQRKHDIDAAKTIDIERVEQLIRKYWPAAISGDRAAAQMVSRFIDQKAAIMGYLRVSPQVMELDAPIRIIEVVRIEQVAPAQLSAPVDVGSDSYAFGPESAPVEVVVEV